MEQLRGETRWPDKCPQCGAKDPTAQHILDTHARPLLPAEDMDGPLGALALLRTDLAPDVLRRNIRLTGQILRGGRDWRWLRSAGPEAEAGRMGGSSESPAANPGDGEAGTERG